MTLFLENEPEMKTNLSFGFKASCETLAAPLPLAPFMVTRQFSTRRKTQKMSYQYTKIYIS